MTKRLLGCWSKPAIFGPAKRPEKTHLLHWSQGVLEGIRIQLLETCACQGLRKVHAIIEGFNLQTLEGHPSGINSGNGKKRHLQLVFKKPHVFFVVVFPAFNLHL